jgi:hypothetical protein
MATKTIDVSGNNMTISASKPVCFYSATGDIDFSSAGTTVTGIVYAPKGTVNLSGSLTFNGSIIGYKISGAPGNMTLGEPTVPIDFLPGGGEATIKLVE